MCTTGCSPRRAANNSPTSSCNFSCNFLNEIPSEHKRASQKVGNLESWECDSNSRAGKWESACGTLLSVPETASAAFPTHTPNPMMQGAGLSTFGRRQAPASRGNRAATLPGTATARLSTPLTWPSWNERVERIDQGPRAVHPGALVGCSYLQLSECFCQFLSVGGHVLQLEFAEATDHVRQRSGCGGAGDPV